MFNLKLKIMKNFLIFALACLFILSSCGKEAEVKKDGGNQIKTVTFAELYSNKYENPKVNVAVEGQVVHVCKHSGKKIFIIGSNPNDRFQIFAGEKITSFPQDLEGCKVRVIGLLEEEKIDGKYLDEWESEIASNEKENAKSKDSKASCAFENERKEVLDLRTKIAQSPKGYFSLYSMTAVEYKKL